MGEEEEMGLELKTVAHKDQEAKAKTQAAATDIMPSTEAPEADAKSKAAAQYASNLSSLASASMLAQVCERAFMEHQLAACHFTFYSFCECP